MKESVRSIGKVLPTSRNTLLVASSHGVLEFDPATKNVLRNFGVPLDNWHERAESDDTRLRFNDAVIAPDGSALFGVMYDESGARKRHPGEAYVAQLTPGGHWKRSLEGFGTPNGICFAKRRCGLFSCNKERTCYRL